MADTDPLTAELDYLNGIHREVTLPSGEVICDSDRRKWPCHARRLLETLRLLLTAHAAYVTREEHDRLTAILAGETGDE